ncbi:hypothetical protein GWI33_021023 [Rhynchophorus ferrugineus]|uniref:Uncharacterized protein n=1 Tax=Rhynchophorus ferrugineus TaxID=354439 RepID=A0A834HPL3_RHYFE|nr:hypothetical protein GWI33_021023 [Rhynchophorus ferrugineus]
MWQGVGTGRQSARRMYSPMCAIVPTMEQGTGNAQRLEGSSERRETTEDGVAHKWNSKSENDENTPAEIIMIIMIRGERRMALLHTADVENAAIALGQESNRKAMKAE